MDLNRYRLPGLEKRFSREPRNKAFLVIAEFRQKSKNYLDESLAEMRELTFSAGMKIVGEVQANVPQPSPSHFIREGKLTEVRDAARKAGANVIIFNVDLTPGQASNVEAFTKVSTMDRTGLILEIFGKRAKTNEGKLQVELAQLTYSLPRLGGLGGVMSRLGGGVGTRGPGEQELEHDRRKVRRRIQQVKSELEKVKKHRQLLRDGRKRKNFLTVALVGYTNAGKSTLLNALTGADSKVQDKMFATLDPVTRRETINGRGDVLFIDTVGFLRDLPHTLVESFHATLEEVVAADILVHVLDASSPKFKELKEATEKVLREIKADQKPVLLALNKADLLNEAERRGVQSEWPDGILVSAKEKLGLQSLAAKLETFLEKKDE